jgi:hypothetical protein
MSVVAVEVVLLQVGLRVCGFGCFEGDSALLKQSQGRVAVSGGSDSLYTFDFGYEGVEEAVALAVRPQSMLHFRLGVVPLISEVLILSSLPLTSCVDS